MHGRGLSYTYGLQAPVIGDVMGLTIIERCFDHAYGMATTTLGVG